MLTCTNYRVDEFGTAWAQDDEEDCPAPPPPFNMCQLFIDMGFAIDQAEYEETIGKVLGGMKILRTLNSFINLEKTTPWHNNSVFITKIMA